MEEVQGSVAEDVGAFAKYDKMGEHSGSVGAAALSASANRYLVTEKVHGANFCIIAKALDAAAETVDVKFAKRTDIIGGAHDADDFYSCRSTGLLRVLEPCAGPVLRAVRALPGCGGVRAVHVYGELFGGEYPHADVPAVKGLLPVQHGIWYAPDLQFMGFDVCLEEPGQCRRYLDFSQARAICESCGLLFAEPLFEGSLADCLEQPYEFESTIPARLGLPPLDGDADGERNLAEGVVVRPSREPAVSAGGAARAGGGKESARGLFKRKIEAFSEKRYQNTDWKKGKSGGGGINQGMQEEEITLVEIQASVTDQRLAAVMSKVGRVDPHDKEALARLLADFEADVQEALEEADAQRLRQSRPLQEQLRRLSKEVINEYFKQQGVRMAKKAAS